MMGPCVAAGTEWRLPVIDLQARRLTSSVWGRTEASLNNVALVGRSHLQSKCRGVCRGWKCYLEHLVRTLHAPDTIVSIPFALSHFVL